MTKESEKNTAYYVDMTEVLSEHEISSIYMKHNKKLVRLVCMISSTIYREVFNGDQFNDPSNVLRAISFHIVFSLIKTSNYPNNYILDLFMK